MIKWLLQSISWLLLLQCQQDTDRSLVLAYKLKSTFNILYKRNFAKLYWRKDQNRCMRVNLFFPLTICQNCAEKILPLSVSHHVQEIFPLCYSILSLFFIPIISLDKLSSLYITTGLSCSTRDLYGISGVLLQI